MSGLTEDVAYIMGGGGCNSENWPDAMERADEIIDLVKARLPLERLLTLATKHCPRGHHDWQEILGIADDT